MTAIDTANLKDKLCGSCNCQGFLPSVGYSINTSTKVIAITDGSTYPATDSAKSIIVRVYDQKGGVVAGKLTNGVAANVTATALDFSNLTITATVVSTKGCKADLSAYHLGVQSLAGNLGNTALAGDADDTQ